MESITAAHSVTLLYFPPGSMKKKEERPYTNSLISETSPYLLQHAHNPVNWFAWNEPALARARSENKLILVSIGYSACHWCHVMEHECFEDAEVARIMNEHFVCIKVDREERPDIDQVYMAAVQLMTGRGGWPLNCFCLPDGRPVYGGTYFPKESWMSVLEQLAQGFSQDPDKFYEYAEELTGGVRKMELVKKKEEAPDLSFETLQNAVRNWKKRFDSVEGGQNYAPKFPLPNNWEFLLHYAAVKNDREILSHVTLTLDKMAMGGIYDQLGGGFARYSTDMVWKVPHFEKMLYDNAQLVSLYSHAWLVTKNDLYRNIVFETLGFIGREMTSDEGAFYSALDADSEGEEGKYYVWKREELEKLLKQDFGLFADYYSVSNRSAVQAGFGLWEHGNYVLLRRKSEDEIAAAHKISVQELRRRIAHCKNILLEERNKRVRPGLDDKTLCSWNALMAQGYVDAYTAFGEPAFLKAAWKNLDFILKKMRRPDGGLFHSYKAGRATINAYLEDYAFTIEALIALYQATFDESWLGAADELMRYSIVHFLDRESGMFFFTSDLDPELIARKMETSDNVIPASNSSIARSLFCLYHYYGNAEYLNMSRQMLVNMEHFIADYPSGYSNWARLHIWLTAPFREVAIVGNSVNEMRQAMQQHYLPNVIFAGSSSASKLPLLQNRFAENRTLIYVCEDRSCQQPVEDAEKALTLIWNGYG
ncbi:MAG: thioredoxin domain-containing protein [Bacteroidota bacterium]